MSCCRPSSPGTRRPCSGGCTSWWRRSSCTSRGCRRRRRIVFKHALIQDAAYQSLLRSTRQQYHQRIAQVLEAQFPAVVETAARAAGPPLYGGGLRDAGRDLLAAARAAGAQRSAHQEAVGHLTTGLAVLADPAGHPEPPAPGPAAPGRPRRVADGRERPAAPEVERVYTRARALCQQVGDTPQLFPVLWGLCLFYLNCGQRQTAQELGGAAPAPGAAPAGRGATVLGHYLLGQVLFILGAWGRQGSTLRRPLLPMIPRQHRPLAHVYGIDLGSLPALGAWCSWLLGLSRPGPGAESGGVHAGAGAGTPL